MIRVEDVGGVLSRSPCQASALIAQLLGVLSANGSQAPFSTSFRNTWEVGDSISLPCWGLPMANH